MPRVVLWLPPPLLLLLFMVAGALVTLPAAPALVVRRRLLLALPVALALVGMVGVAPRDEARVLLPAMLLSSCVAVVAWAAGGGGCCGCLRPMPVCVLVCVGVRDNLLFRGFGGGVPILK